MIFAAWFISTLAWWQWLLLATVPPAIIALYFLKLRRHPLEVPSTYLWRRTIEDLHVNSLWQRLRQSILLFLQLLLVLLVILACLRPGWRGKTLEGDRFIFLIDNSASMSATDVEPSRLELAKQRVGQMIDQMKSGDVAMIVSFSDTARIEQQFTDNRNLLRRKLQQIEPTNRTTELGEALRVAAGLANPGRSSEADNTTDVQVADALEANLFIFSDGGFDRVENFSMGNLKEVYFAIGAETCRNVGIVAFSTQRNELRPDRLQAFGRLENFGPEDVAVEVSLFLDDRFKDAKQIEVPSQGIAGLEFDLDDVETGTLRLQIEQDDHLPLDDVAFAAVNVPRRARVLLVTPGNGALETALATDQASRVAEIAFQGPEVLPAEADQKNLTKRQQQYVKAAQSGAYDLIIYDQCAPANMPQANTLFIGTTPPMEEWAHEPRQEMPQIIDTDRAHPLMQFVEMGDVELIADCLPLKPPDGGDDLIDADVGTILAIGPREGFEDAVLAFEIEGADPETKKRYSNTDWPIRFSFPVFVNNVLTYLGGGHGTVTTGSSQPGKPILVRSIAPVDRIRITPPPPGEAKEVLRRGQSGFVYTETDELGVYDVREGTFKQVTQQFTVNLFDPTETDIRPKLEVEAGYETIKGETTWTPMRQETWKYLLLAALIVLGLEWYIFNRRVYL